MPSRGVETPAFVGLHFAAASFTPTYVLLVGVREGLSARTKSDTFGQLSCSQQAKALKLTNSTSHNPILHAQDRGVAFKSGEGLDVGAGHPGLRADAQDFGK